MCSQPLAFLTRERKNWMRLRSHTVIFDTDPHFPEHRRDPSGVLMRILHIWLTDTVESAPVIRACVGSIRFCEGWYSRRELMRLFRRAASSAAALGQSRAGLRTSLGHFLREYFRLRG